MRWHERGINYGTVTYPKADVKRNLKHLLGRDRERR
jgi:hypothetical protein